MAMKRDEFGGGVMGKGERMRESKWMRGWRREGGGGRNNG